MGKVLIIFFFSISVYAQNNRSIDFESFKQHFESNKIEPNSLGIDESYELNEAESKTLYLLNNSTDNFQDKKTAFVTGSAGTTIATKKRFFDDFKLSYKHSGLLSYTIVKLDENGKSISGFDYIVYFWAKTYNPHSKSLLKKLNKIQTIK